MTFIFKLKNEDGSTLIETLVAMAILVSVLLPASIFLGYMTATPQNEEKILALGLAQSEMEEVLNSELFSNHEKIVKNRWIIRNTFSASENLVQIEVSVYRRNNPRPVVTLSTERLLYDDDSKK